MTIELGVDLTEEEYADLWRRIEDRVHDEAGPVPTPDPERLRRAIRAKSDHIDGGMGDRVPQR